MADGVLNPSISAVQKALCRQELQKHCCRCTWGTEETVEAIESLLLALSAAIDERGDEGHLAEAEASCQVLSGPCINPAVH